MTFVLVAVQAEQSDISALTKLLGLSVNKDELFPPTTQKPTTEQIYQPLQENQYIAGLILPNITAIKMTSKVGRNPDIINCTTPASIDTCRTGSCTGDSVFCNIFPCTNNANNTCNLIIVNLAATVITKGERSFYHIGDGIVRRKQLDALIDSIYNREDIRAKLTTEIVRPEPEENMQADEPDLEHGKGWMNQLAEFVGLSDENIHIRENDRKILYSTSSPGIIRLQRRTVQLTVDVYPPGGMIDIPQEFQRWRMFNVFFKNEDGQTTLSVTLDFQGPCSGGASADPRSESFSYLCLIDQILTTAKTILIILGVVLSLLLFAVLREIINILGKFFRIVSYLLKIILAMVRTAAKLLARTLKPLRASVIRTVRPARRRLPALTYQQLQEALETSEDDLLSPQQTTSRVTSPPTTVTPRRSTRQRNRTGVGFLGLTFLIALASSCEDSHIVQGTLDECRISGDHQTCSIKFEAQITLDNLGAQACLDIIDEQEPDAEPVRITLKYDQLLCKAPLNLKYYTTDYEPATMSVVRCQFTTGCSEQECLTIEPNSDAFGNLKNEVLQYPGRTKCKTPQGLLGCFSLYYSCFFFRHYLKPIPQTDYTVYEVTEKPSCESSVSIAFGDSNMSAILTKGTTGSSPYIEKGLSISISGRYEGASLPLMKDIVIDNTDAKRQFWAATSHANSPLVGLLGDIQSSTRNFTMAKYASNIFAHCNEGLSGMACNHEPSAISQIEELGERLPLIRPRSTIRVKEGQLVIERRESGALVLRIQADGGLRISRRTKKVCPSNPNFLSISGCYSCPGGFVVLIKMKSDCHPGRIRVTAVGTGITLTTGSIELATELKVITLYGTGTQSEVKATLFFKTREKEITLEIEGILDAPEVFINANTTNYAALMGITPDSNFFSFFGPLVSFFRGFFIGKFFFIIIILIILFLAIYRIIKCTAVFPNPLTSRSKKN